MAATFSDGTRAGSWAGVAGAGARRLHRRHLGRRRGPRGTRVARGVGGETRPGRRRWGRRASHPVPIVNLDWLDGDVTRRIVRRRFPHFANFYPCGVDRSSGASWPDDREGVERVCSACGAVAIGGDTNGGEGGVGATHLFSPVPSRTWSVPRMCTGPAPRRHARGRLADHRSRRRVAPAARTRGFATQLRAPRGVPPGGGAGASIAPRRSIAFSRALRNPPRRMRLLLRRARQGCVAMRWGDLTATKPNAASGRNASALPQFGIASRGRRDQRGAPLNSRLAETGQPTTSPSAAPEGSGSGRRSMRKPFTTPTSEARSVTSSAT
jgi:hypothetical protein